MTIHDQVLRIKSLSEKKKRKAILSAAKHNLRELPPELHIDAERSHLNRVLYGPATAAEVAHRAKQQMDAASIKPRAVDTIIGVEVLICLPPAFDGDAMAFFRDSLGWADEFFQVPVLSAIAHFDEPAACLQPAPHLHIILLPIIGGKLNGGAVMGDLKRIQAMHATFHDQVGRRYGLRRKTAQKRSQVDRRTAAESILDAIVANPAMLRGGQVKALLLDAIGKDVDAYAGSVGVALPEPAAKASKETFVGIMTKRQRVERKRSPIGVAPVAGMPESRAKKMNPYALIGVRTSPPADLPVRGCIPSALEPDPIPANDGDFTRIRDDELDAECWDADHGKFIPIPPKASRKAQVQHAVRVALSAVGRYR